jgi:type IV pilus assembly protein PilQ
VKLRNQSFWILFIFLLQLILPVHAQVDLTDLDGVDDAEQESLDSGDEDEDVGASSGGRIDVLDIGFDSKFQDANRLFVKTSRPASIEKKQDGNRFTLIIKDARVPRNLSRPLDTSQFEGNVSGISIANVSSPYPGVKLVVVLRDQLAPRVSQQGEFVYADFPKGAGNSGGLVNLDDLEGSDDDAEDGLDDLEDDEDLNDREFSPSQKKKRVVGTPLDAGPVRLAESSVGDVPSRFYGQPISIETSDAPILDVIGLISEISGLNIIAGSDVTGTISLKLRNVPWDQALFVVLQAKSLGYKRQGNVLRIASLTTLQTEATSVKKAKQEQIAAEPIRTRVIRLNFQKAENIAKSVGELLSTDGKSFTESSTNTIIIRDNE